MTGKRWLILVLFSMLSTGCASRIDEWVTGLRSGDESERLLAADRLAASGDRKAVPHLLESLTDGVPLVRLAVAEALGKLGDASGVEPLIAHLEDENENLMVRLGVADALAEIGGDRALEKLLEIAKDEVSEALRIGALEALGRIDDERSVAALNAGVGGASRETQWASALALGKAEGRGSVEPLIEAMEKADQQLRDLFQIALGTIEPDWRSLPAVDHAVDRMITGMRSADFREALSRYRTVQALSDLDPEWRDRVAAEETRQHFRGLLGAGDTDARRQAAQVLGEIGDRRALPSLLAAANDPSRDVRYAVIQALGEIGDETATPVLVEALKSRDPGIVSAVALALGNLGDSWAVGPLTAVLTNPDTSVQVFRLGAVQTLGALKSETSVKPLVGMLGDRDEGMKIACVEALGGIRNREAVAPLVGLLSDRSAEVRLAAVKALGDIGDPAAVDSLIAVMRTGRIWARHVVPALNRIDSEWRTRESARKVVADLVERLDHKRGDIQLRAAEALGEIADPQSSRALLGALEQRHELIVGGAYRFFIGKGIREAEPLLISGLGTFGTEEMALTFLNSGHSRLAKAARRWGQMWGVVLLASPEFGPVAWAQG